MFDLIAARYKGYSTIEAFYKLTTRQVVLLAEKANAKNVEELTFKAKLAGKELKESVTNEPTISDKTKEYAEKVRRKIAERGKVHEKD